ncbi:MAG: hypothetical protein A2V70_10960 [Planctomycetes bacterium RBG_13_63_9]|nr:MAG: hypothetical protein A2V70_10960 [Planctomycetes bacterium RBG_13_63_9]
MYARVTVILIILATAAMWAATIRPADGFAVGIGRYRVEVLAVNVLATYLALLLCYVVLGRRSWKIRAARAVLSLSAILVALLLVELPAALGLVDYREVLYPRLASLEGPDQVQRDPELVFRHPGHGRFEHEVTVQPDDPPAPKDAPAGRQRKVVYRYDRNGFRNPHDLRQADVILIGDSFVEGFAVAEERTCSAQLARLLDVEVANLGHDDYGPPQELIVLRKFGLPLRPRVVVWFFFEGNDLLDLADFEIALGGWRRWLTRGEGFAARCFCLNALERVDLFLEAFRWRDCGLRRKRSARLLPEIRDDDVTMQFGEHYGFGAAELSPYELGLLPKAQEVLAEAKAVCDRSDVRLLVVCVPTKFRVYRDLCMAPEDSQPEGWHVSDLPDRLARWCRAAGIEYVDLTAALQSAARQGPLVYFVDDGHWSPEGHRVVAEAIAEQIRQSGWLESGGQRE